METKNFEEQSSTIRSISYTEETNQLLVEFKSGGTYEYSDVDKETFNEFISHPSVGSYFHKTIKGNYEGRKL
jgi:hypothetical protein